MTTHHATSDINVTPFLDVLLVLLVTFMAVAVAQRHTIDAQLPQPCASGCVESRPLVLEVGPHGQFALDRTPIPAARLEAYLAAVYAARPEKVIFVRGLPGLSYQEMIAAMDAARGAGVRVIALGDERFAAR